jgi:peptide/nickel transport system permease protein
MARKDGEEWTEWKVWPAPKFNIKGVTADGTFLNVTNEWVTSLTGYTLTSETSEIVDMFRSQFSNKDPIQVIFERAKLPTQFRFGLKITFIDVNATKSPETNVFIDNINFDLYGTSWGLLGTDNEGRDLFAQLVHGARISLYVGLLSAILSVVIGLIVGLVSGYIGGIVDEFLMRFNDMLLVLPTLPLLMILVSVLGTRIENLILLLGILGWMGFARLVRSQVLSLKERPFIESAKATGAGKAHIIGRHILPNVMPLVYVTLATSVPGSIVAEAALSWLGFADPMRMSWGRMLHEVQANSAYMCWWWIIPPGLCIALVAMAFILLGYALDEVLNPRLRMRR